ncbi:NAD(P)-binding protein [Gonapodya prolifera JEL478]|uniref:NAD(P)-binding protein n=1 Tax=Gonapodya prolifera (strain JEL478) TaxID=1344416 RepID=A0A139AUU8_GONPJ|nr:NAD(P)-binding protein [Gonapodya prolifera JEL478]|eukprot:KXS20474.1 NAD(P)-binding protein [Gonapodya prolifera JEL478]
MAPKTILVFGATGRQGGACIDALLTLQDHFIIRTLVRHPNGPAAAKLKDCGVEVAQGDLNEPESITRALDGVYGVFLITPFTKREVLQGANVIDAAFQAGVRYLVFTSAAGATSPSGRKFSGYNNKYLIEEKIRAKSWADGFTVIRPGLFFENVEMLGPLIRGSITTVFPGGHKLPLISVYDIGRFASQCFLDPPSFAGKEVTLVSEVLTGAELAQHITYVSGQPWKYSQVLPTRALKVLVPSAAPLLDFVISGDAGAVPYDPIYLHQVIPDLESFKSWCDRKGLAIKLYKLPTYAYGKALKDRAFGWTGMVKV